MTTKESCAFRFGVISFDTVYYFISALRDEGWMCRRDGVNSVEKNLY